MVSNSRENAVSRRQFLKLGALAAGTLSDRMGRRRILLIVSVAAPPLLLAFVYGPDWLAVPLLPCGRSSHR